MNFLKFLNSLFCLAYKLLIKSKIFQYSQLKRDSKFYKLTEKQLNFKIYDIISYCIF